MLEPGTAKEVTTLNAKGYVAVWVGGGAVEAEAEVRGDALIGIKIEDPGVLEGKIAEGPVLVGGPVIEDTLVDVGAVLLGDGDGRVRRERIEDVNIVGPIDGL